MIFKCKYCALKFWIPHSRRLHEEACIPVREAIIAESKFPDGYIPFGSRRENIGHGVMHIGQSDLANSFLYSGPSAQEIAQKRQGTSALNFCEGIVTGVIVAEVFESIFSDSSSSSDDSPSFTSDDGSFGGGGAGSDW